MKHTQAEKHEQRPVTSWASASIAIQAVRLVYSPFDLCLTLVGDRDGTRRWGRIHNPIPPHIAFPNHASSIRDRKSTVYCYALTSRFLERIKQVGHYCYTWNELNDTARVSRCTGYACLSTAIVNVCLKLVRQRRISEGWSFCGLRKLYT